MTNSDTSADQVDQHIDDCGTCGDGMGVCLTGYLLTRKEAMQRV